MQAVCILAFLGLLALIAPANARQLQQAAYTDADLLNFALNLEVSDASYCPSLALAPVSNLAACSVADSPQLCA